MGGVRRSAAYPGQPLSALHASPIAASALVEMERRVPVRRSGRALRERLFPHPLLAAAGRRGRPRRRAGSTRAATRRAASRRTCRARPASSTAPTACLALARRLHARSRLALDDEETLTYLHSTVSTRRHSVRVPETPMHLDAILVDRAAFAGGLEPRLGDGALAHVDRAWASRRAPGPGCSTT